MESDRPLVSLVVPAFDEAGIIERNLDELLNYLAGLQAAYRFELVLVDDGSSDQTGTVADAFAAARSGVHVCHHGRNRGLGAALKTGFARAGGDYIVTLDLDMSYEPAYVAALLDALVGQRAAIALASPYLKGGSVRNVPWTRRQLSAWANHYLSVATGGTVATLTGMVRAYDARALRTLDVAADGMDFNHELVFAALRRGMRVVEIPARLEWRSAPQPESAATPPKRRSSMRILKHAWSVLGSGLRYRPSMLFVIPGLIPGLLPFVLMLLLLLRPSRAVVVDTTLATMAVQGLSLAFLAILTGTYIRQLRSLARRSSLQDQGTRSRA